MTDWLHLKQYGYAPGDYLSKCHECGKTAEFVDKRAIICRPCAEAMHAKAAAPSEPEAQKAPPSGELSDTARLSLLNKLARHRGFENATKALASLPLAGAAQNAVALRDPRMEPFDKHGPLRGMIAAFETHFGQSWTDKDWRDEASTWAAAWGKAIASPSPAASMEVQGQMLTTEEVAEMLMEGSRYSDEMHDFAREVQRKLAAKNGWRLGEGQ